MIFMMKRSTRAHRRSPARLAERRIAACEVLEGRRLMSTGMQFPQAAGETAMLMPGGWASRWIDMAPTLETAGGQAQFVSNLESAGPGTFIEVGPGGAPTQIMSGDSAGTTASSIVTSPEMSASPGDLNVGYGGGQGVYVTGSGNDMTSAASSIGTLPGGTDVSTGIALNPAVTADGAGPVVVGSSADPSSAGVQTVQGGGPIATMSGGAASTVSSPVMNMSSGNLDAGYGGGQGVFVARAGDGTTTTGSSIGALPGGATVGTGDAQAPVVIARDAGSTAAATVTSQASTTFPGDPDVAYGGGTGLYVTRAGYGATNATPSIGSLPGGVQAGTGGGQTAVVAVDGAGPATTGSSVNSSSAGIQTVAGGAPIQIMKGGGTGSTVASPAMSAFAGDPNVWYGGGPVQFVTRAGYGAVNGGFSNGAVPGSVGVGTGGGQYAVAVAQASNSPASDAPVAGGAPMQVVTGTQSQTSAPSVGLG